MKLSFLWTWPKRITEPLRQKWNAWWDRFLRDPRSEEEERLWGAFITTQEEALQEGREIEPPWVVFRGSEPWNFKQGNNAGWIKWIWIPFWKSLDMEKKRGYAHKWKATDDWEELLLGEWLLLGDPEEEQKHQEWLQLYDAQEDALRLGREVEPPWVIYKGMLPKDYTEGGILKTWLNRVWMPFWTGLTLEERRAYVEECNPPPEWRDLLLGDWLGMVDVEQNDYVFRHPPSL